MLPPFSLEQTIDKIVREEWGRILASLVKSLGDFQLAEDCLQDAIISAIDSWRKTGLPKSPAAWLIAVARRRAIDRLRRAQNFASKQPEMSYLADLEHQTTQDEEMEGDVIPDKRLEMIFTCCHPALEEKTRVALTLRTLGGLSTKEIAAAFLDNVKAMEQRLTRAKKKIAAAGIPYRVPDAADLPDRLSSVGQVIYLIFNEGYSAQSGDSLTRANLTNEAIRLGRIMHQLLPDMCEITGLLALMLLHDARRTARMNDAGEMIPLSDQNRSRWNHAKIAEGVALTKSALRQKRIGPYQIQAAISAVHGQSPTWKDTDWHEICALYEVLYGLEPTPVVQLNQAVALSYTGALPAALNLLNQAGADGALDHYQHFFAAKADILERLGQTDAALKAYEQAITLSQNAQETAFLKDKMNRL